MSLKNKKILITAGQTWVPIDRVRVISNLATGESGILLAKKLQRLGAKVTLLLGPVEACCLSKKIKLLRFRFFDELREGLIRLLRTKKFDFVIHSAAVSDYKPQNFYRHKLKSGIKHWQLNLVPTEKLIDLMKRIGNSLFLVGFKFEPDADKDLLIDRSRILMREAGLDLAVANSSNKGRYLAYVISPSKIYGPMLSKKDMAEKLIKLMGENLCKN